MVGLYGSVSRQLALQLFGSDPFTDKIERKKYELLLKQTNEFIVNHLVRDNWKNKLTPFPDPNVMKTAGQNTVRISSRFEIKSHERQNHSAHPY